MKMKVNGERITNAGLIVEVINATPTRVRTRIVDVFFPVHKRPYGTYQVDELRQDYLRDVLVGQEREFWKTGSRAGYAIGGNEIVVDWAYEGEVA